MKSSGKRSELRLTADEERLVAAVMRLWPCGTVDNVQALRYVEPWMFSGDEVKNKKLNETVWGGELVKARLDSFERQIEKAADTYRPLSKKERQKVESLLDRVRKSRTINIRIAESVLEELKRRSREEGLPYQTLISSILHRYVTNRLVDEAAIRKSLQLLQQK